MNTNKREPSGSFFYLKGWTIWKLQNVKDAFTTCKKKAKPRCKKLSTVLSVTLVLVSWRKNTNGHVQRPLRVNFTTDSTGFHKVNYQDRPIINMLLRFILVGSLKADTFACLWPCLLLGVAPLNFRVIVVTSTFSGCFSGFWWKGLKKPPILTCSMLKPQFFLATFRSPFFHNLKKLSVVLMDWAGSHPLHTLFCLILAGRRPALEEESPLIRRIPTR